MHFGMLFQHGKARVQTQESLLQICYATHVVRTRRTELRPNLVLAKPLPSTTVQNSKPKNVRTRRSRDFFRLSSGRPFRANYRVGLTSLLDRSKVVRQNRTCRTGSAAPAHCISKSSWATSGAKIYFAKNFRDNLKSAKFEQVCCRRSYNVVIREMLTRIFLWFPSMTYRNRLRF